VTDSEPLPRKWEVSPGDIVLALLGAILLLFWVAIVTGIVQ